LGVSRLAVEISPLHSLTGSGILNECYRLITTVMRIQVLKQVRGPVLAATRRKLVRCFSGRDGPEGLLKVALPDDLKEIAGAQELHDWFGYWPDFHDAGIISLHLNRTDPSILTIHTWETTDEVDDAGYYVQVRDVVVQFILDISGDDNSLELYGFSQQNVIMSLAIGKIDSRYKLVLAQCFGLAGTIKADNISIRLTPGEPAPTQQEGRPSGDRC
jgi:hypothetical protein